MRRVVRTRGTGAPAEADRDDWSAWPRAVAWTPTTHARRARAANGAALIDSRVRDVEQRGWVDGRHGERAAVLRESGTRSAMSRHQSTPATGHRPVVTLGTSQTRAQPGRDRDGRRGSRGASRAGIAVENARLTPRARDRHHVQRSCAQRLYSSAGSHSRIAAAAFAPPAKKRRKSEGGGGLLRPIRRYRTRRSVGMVIVREVTGKGRRRADKDHITGKPTTMRTAAL